MKPDNQTQFAHPVEEEFANILDFYQIRWEYEPRTFALEWDEAFRNMNDPSGRAVSGVHSDAYVK